MMSQDAQQDYRRECIALGAESCDLELTPEQLECLADSAQGGHEHYGMAFYSPPSSDRLSTIEAEWKSKLDSLRKEFDNYRSNSEKAIRSALSLRSESNISIEQHGDVFLHEGRTYQIL